MNEELIETCYDKIYSYLELIREDPDRDISEENEITSILEELQNLLE